MKAHFEEPYLLSIDQVKKQFGSFTALHNVSLSIKPGEIFALLGANGAGKTTLIECVCGLMTKFEGEIRVAGYDVQKDYRITRQLVGLVPQEINYDSFLKSRQALHYQGGYFGRHGLKERTMALLRAFRLEDKAEVNSRKLSGGMKRRLMICKALMHEPALLFLDEPTAGVDVELRDELWSYIEKLRESGTTIVLTTHYLEEAERLADRIGIIHQGRILRVAEREKLMLEFGRRWVEVVLSEEVPERLLGALDGLNPVRTAPRRLRIEFAEAHAVQAHPFQRLQAAVAKEGMVIDSVEGGLSRLEDVFREIVHANE
ncbi:MAG TPA: ABC transporter ATP-binding protein [Opitutales bacterium]|nr:ABC transporter ATP-binding protein [Opitutales bacterium]